MNKHDGFTLFEVLISIALLSMFLLITEHVFYDAMQSTQHSVKKTIANITER